MNSIPRKKRAKKPVVKKQDVFPLRHSLPKGTMAVSKPSQSSAERLRRSGNISTKSRHFNKLNIGLTVLILLALIAAVLYIYTRHQRDYRVLGVAEIAEMQIPKWYKDPLIVSQAGKMLSITPVAGQRVKVEHLPAQAGINNQHIYRNAYPYTDVIQTDYKYKIKEELVFHQPGHPIKFEYQLGNIDKYYIEEDEDGNIIFYDQVLYEKYGQANNLSRLFTMPAPFIKDSQNNKSFSAVNADIKQGLLTITIDQSWLSQATYPVTLDPTIEINILNVHSHPQQGDNWEVSFVTQGQADLKIIPFDQATIDDDEFVSLWCGNEQREPQILDNDVIYYPNWSCEGVGKVIHYTKKAGHHILKFNFGGQIVYAYNASLEIYNTATAGTDFTVPAYVSSITIKSWGAGAGGGAGGNNGPGGVGGGGGYVEDDISVSEGDTITVVVGANGGGGSKAAAGQDDGAGGGGGGFSGAKLNGSYVVIAGAGAGGGAGSAVGEEGGPGGGGGGSSGQDGTVGNDGCSVGGGDFGSGANGGTGGAGGSDCDVNGADGTAGGNQNPGASGGGGGDGDSGTGGGAGGASDGIYTGGTGGDSSTVQRGGAGGGGAGYAGGGGGEGGDAEGSGGGGGGSGWCSGTCTTNTPAPDNNPANNSDADFIDNCTTASQAAGGAAGLKDASGSNGGPGCVLLIYTVAPPSAPIITQVSAPSARPGSDVSFTVDWDDEDAGEQVKVKICKTNSLTGLNCADGYWASSTAFTTSDPATVSTTTVGISDGHYEFWAFVCDGDNLCSGGWHSFFRVGYSTYVNSPITNKYTSGLVGHWTFNGPDMDWGSSTAEALDRSGYDKNGDVSGASPVAGVSGQGLEFDGVGDYVDCGDVYNSVKTIAFWLKADDISDRDIIDIDGTDYIDIDSSSNIVANSFPAATIYVDSAAAATITSDWHFITIVDTTGVNASDMDIGKASNNYFDGLLDEVRLYDYALNVGEVLDLYRAGARRILIDPTRSMSRMYLGGGSWICGTSRVNDIESNSYGTVLIGNQCWMTENMRTTTYPDGSSITKGDAADGDSDWATDQAWYSCPPNAGNNGEDCDAATSLGMLYQWSAAMASSTIPADDPPAPGDQGICPTGWHVPTDAEQHILDDYLDETTCNGARDGSYDCDPAGSKLAGNDADDADWTAGTLDDSPYFDSSGFNEPSSGYRSSFGDYSDRTKYAILWSSSEAGAKAWYRYLFYNDVGVNRVDVTKSYGCSVRCLKN